MARVRMRDVAEHAGVSVRTVSNVVNGYAHVSPDMRTRVQRSLDELGYRMDYLARGLRSGRTGFIALVVPCLDDPYFALLAQAVVRAAAGRGLGVLVEMTGHELAAGKNALPRGLANVADGVLLCQLRHSPEPGPPPPPGFPLVVIGQDGPGPQPDRVALDDTAAARTAVEHLIASGRKRIVMIGPGAGGAGRRRAEGCRQALAGAGLSPVTTPAPAPAEPDLTAGMAGMDAFLAGADQLPDAVFAHNDVMAIGVLRSLAGHGIRVPAEVAVIGVDGIAEGAYLTPSLSTVAFDLPALAGQALDLLDEQSRDEARPRRPRQVLAPFRLIARESTGTGASDAGPARPGA